MRAGTLDRHVVIEQAASTVNGHGQPVLTWSTFATRMAEKRDVRARERFTANQTIAVEAATFRMRYVPGVTPKMRLQAEGKTWDITGIVELGRRAGHDITAEARVDED